MFDFEIFKDLNSYISFYKHSFSAKEIQKYFILFLIISLEKE